MITDKRVSACALAAVCIAAIAVPIASSQTTYYVNDACGDDSWTGTSHTCQAPDGPKRTIQAGIDISASGDTVIVADGVYTGTGNRDLTYAGRDVTLRSENGPANCTIDCQGSRSNEHRAFVFENGETRSAVLDGLTIRRGFVELALGHSGGGILCTSSPMIQNCVFLGNSASSGGGLAVEGNGSPVIRNCVFERNSGGGMFCSAVAATIADCDFRLNSGGGLAITGVAAISRCLFEYNYSSGTASAGAIGFRGNPTVVVNDCVIRFNSGYFGGIMVRWVADVTLVDCEIIGNTFGGIGTWDWGVVTLINCRIFNNNSISGGAVLIRPSNAATLMGCLIRGNSAILDGGAIAAIGDAMVDLSNCTIVNNFAGADGSAVFCTDNATVDVTNTVLWENPAPTGSAIVLRETATVTIRYSDFGGTVFREPGTTLNWGAGNISTDPVFVDPINGDYRLSAGSPVIDAGDNTAVSSSLSTDLDGNPRFVDDPGTPDTGLPGGAGGQAVVDMGAYEFQTASFPAGDMNCDGRFNGADIDPFFLALGDPAAYTARFPNCNILNGDMNGDGALNGADIDLFFQCLAAGGCP